MPSTSGREAQFALITGCSTGIGFALSCEFASQGVHVLATARQSASLKTLTERYSNITALAFDARDPKGIEILAQAVLKLTGGRLNYLVNNAGVHYATTAHDIEQDELRALFEVNVISVMMLCRTFMPALINSKGMIVQIGSVTRAVPVVWQSPYNATKAALSQYTNTLRLELAPFDVNVVEVVTGYVQSNILHKGLHAPEDSRYLPIKKHIETLKQQGNRNGMPGAVYAKSVVQQLLRNPPPAEIWEGGQAWTLRFIVSYLPQWLSRWIFYSTFKLHLLKAH